nr:hypothetical protein Iba_chr11cCG7930 [Ipomoea batatas]
MSCTRFLPLRFRVDGNKHYQSIKEVEEEEEENPLAEGLANAAGDQSLCVFDSSRRLEEEEDHVWGLTFVLPRFSQSSCASYREIYRKEHKHIIA